MKTMKTKTGTTAIEETAVPHLRRHQCMRRRSGWEGRAAMMHGDLLVSSIEHVFCL